MQLTEEQIAAVVAAAAEDIKVKAVQEAQSIISTYTRQAVHDTLYAEVKTFVEKDVLPQVKDALLQGRGALVETAVRSSHEIADALSTAMLERMKKTLASEYEAREIFKKLFGIY